MTAFKRIQF